MKPGKRGEALEQDSCWLGECLEQNRMRVQVVSCSFLLFARGLRLPLRLC